MRRPDGSMTSFLDIVLNACLTFVFLFAIALAHVSQHPTEADIRKPKAEFLIVVDWDPGRDVDVDSWIQTPNEEVLYFRKQQNEYAHIDRDDTGIRGDIALQPDGTRKVNPKNQEIVTFRQACAGEWVINVHLFRRDAEPPPVTVRVRVLKLNPAVGGVTDRTLVLNRSWEEQTVVRLVTDRDGNVVSQNAEYKPLLMRG
jgi:hypothetical protein